MQDKGWEVDKIGDKDGIFWMSLNDFFLNFEQLFMCRFFDSKEYEEIKYHGEWSIGKGTAGGCTNNPSCG